jgi:hypothetical protein
MSSSTVNDAARREARDKREQAVIDKLSTFVLIPGAEIFEQVVSFLSVTRFLNVFQSEARVEPPGTV